MRRKLQRTGGLTVARKGAPRRKRRADEGFPLRYLRPGVRSEMLNPSVLQALQQTRGNRAVQRLIEHSRHQRPVAVQRLRTPTGDAVDIGALDYKQLHYYQSLHNERQIEPTAHTNVFNDEAEDMRQIRARLAVLEPLAAEVKCGEGETKIAGAGQKVDFGGVTSCMTFTCVLADGRKVVSHEGVKQRSNAMTAIPALMRDKAVTSPVQKLFAVGVGGSWTHRLEPVTSTTGHDMVSNKKAEFGEFVKASLGAGAAAFSFTEHSAGDVKVTAGGTLLAEEIDAAVMDYLGENEFYDKNSAPRSGVVAHLEAAMGLDTATASSELTNYLKNAPGIAGTIDPAR